MRNLLGVAVVTVMAAGPLLWAACTEPPPPAAPAAPSDSGAPSASPAPEPSHSPSTAEAPGTSGPTAAVPGPAGASTSSTGDASPELDRLVGAIPRKGSVHTAAQCQGLQQKAITALDAARTAAGACAADADCEIIHDGTCVQASCGQSVARAARARYEADRRRITEAACGAWDAGGCNTKYPIPMPSCAIPAPVCVQGRCSGKW